MPFRRWGLMRSKIRGRIEIQPRFKIQYPMKNHNKDAQIGAKRCMINKINFMRKCTYHRE